MNDTSVLQIALCAVSCAATLLALLYARSRCRLRRLRWRYSQLFGEHVEASLFAQEFFFGLGSDVYVEEDPDTHSVNICRKGMKREAFVLKKYYYRSDDPDDREYTRIHAEEVADKFNERP